MHKTLYSRRNKQFLIALRNMREGSGMTQVELARKLKITQSQVGKVERGERRLDVVELEIWCKAFGVPLREFVESF
jgi:transcriptional regulator with XRE-family HTH domain